MIWSAIFAALQALTPWEDDPLAGELLDYRGRRAECQVGLPEHLWRSWNCGRLNADRRLLEQKLARRPDLLALLDNDVDEKERFVLVTANERRSASVRRVVFEGAIEGAKKVVVTANGEKKLTRLSIERADRSPLIVIPGETIDDPDLTSMHVNSRRDYLFVDLDFGVRRPWCFTNDEGLSRITFAVANDRVEVQRRDVVHCKQVYSDVKFTIAPLAGQSER